MKLVSNQIVVQLDNMQGFWLLLNIWNQTAKDIVMFAWFPKQHTEQTLQVLFWPVLKWWLCNALKEKSTWLISGKK
jgi:hypothetical protein